MVPAEPAGPRDDADHYELHDYPFDRQTLDIRLEHRWFGTDKMRFVPDDGTIPEGSSARDAFFSRDLDMVQWYVLSVDHAAEPYRYETDFGSIEKGLWDGLSSRYAFRVHIARPFFLIY